MSDLETQRDIGRLEGQVSALTDGVEELRVELRTMREELKPVIATANQVQGGWKARTAMCALAGAVGSALMALFLKVKGQ